MHVSYTISRNISSSCNTCTHIEKRSYDCKNHMQRWWWTINKIVCLYSGGGGGGGERTTRLTVLLLADTWIRPTCQIGSALTLSGPVGYKILRGVNTN